MSAPATRRIDQDCDPAASMGATAQMRPCVPSAWIGRVLCGPPAPRSCRLTPAGIRVPAFTVTLLFSDTSAAKTFIGVPAGTTVGAMPRVGPRIVGMTAPAPQ
ncbi:hypothetical protein D3C80_1126510 [compost metagenome]